MNVRGMGRWGAALLCALWGARAAAQGDPAQVGSWSAVSSWPAAPTHAHLLPTGKVLYFGEFDDGYRQYLWDPATGTSRVLPDVGFNIFCAGHSWLADGRLLLTGGHIDSHIGTDTTVIFDPYTETWAAGPALNGPRWYPTNTTLANGEVVVVSGETHGAGMINERHEVYDPVTGAYRQLSTADYRFPYYPRQFLAPNGKVFIAGPQALSFYLDTSGTGSLIPLTRLNQGGRTYGGGVMYEPGKVLMVGGATPPLATAEVIDLTAPQLAWRYTAPMSTPRRQHNTTLLPDGRVLVTGGSSGPLFDDRSAPVYHPEVWDPVTEAWTSWAPNRTYRGYHSSALLLQDGRILIGGSRFDRTAEIFSPPYLHRGARPRVTAAPTSLLPGRTFFVQTPDAVEATQVTMLALGSVTHATDMGQRFNRLSFRVVPGGLEVTAPANNNVAPPGPWMLFLLNEQGVPSLGHVFRLQIAPESARKAIALSDVWRYDDTGVDPGSTWMTPGFDDSRWASGPGQLGYGETDQVTLLTRTAPVRPSAYFRRRFSLSAVPTSARLSVVHDDGVAVFVNGMKVVERHVGAGLGHAVYATASAENEVTTIVLDPMHLRAGENVIAVVVKQNGPTSPDLSFALELDVVGAGGAEPPPPPPPPPPPAEPMEVISFGHTWRYRADGLDPGATWAQPTFDDRAWAVGRGQLGYGERDEATVLPRPTPSQTSVYFRTAIDLHAPPATADLGVIFDDGIAVYVNGQLVFERNTGRGLAHEAYASASVDNLRVTASIPTSAFVAGRNVIAVMVKQVGRTSPDLSFDLALTVHGGAHASVIRGGGDSLAARSPIPDNRGRRNGWQIHPVNVVSTSGSARRSWSGRRGRWRGISAHR